MSVRIISDGTEAVLTCSTSGVAFGPVFDSEQEAEEFLEWLRENGPRIRSEAFYIGALGNGTDPRDFTTDALVGLRLRYLDSLEVAS
jgi:hypothetical protein